MLVEVHARGQLVKGTFTPSTTAVSLSKAPIFSQSSTPLLMRFSCDTGNKDIADNDADANPRGFAIRFVLSEDGHTHYDIITNTAPGFAVSTGEGFLAMFKGKLNNNMDQFFADYPHGKYFAENHKPLWPYSFATEQWHGVHAFKFIDGQGKETFFRWRIVPVQGVMKYSKADAEAQGRTYLFDDLEHRLSHNRPIKYRLMAQIAEPGDELNDSTKVWPESREFAEMGEIVIDHLWTMNEGVEHGREQKRIIYDPMPRYMEGVAASDDPLIEMRTSVYLQSGRIRREADHLA